jgi:hypothetical protein
MRRLANAIGVLISTVLFTLIVGEAVIRTTNPTPRRNVFRTAVAGPLVLMDGVPTWRDGEANHDDRAAKLEDVACDGVDAFRVLVLGDSIFNGISVAPDDVASVRLARDLRAELGDAHACVKNLAVPGHSLYQTLARGRDVLDSFKPDVVLMELWGGPPRTPILNGTTVYSIEGSPDAARQTYNPLGLPGGLHDALMTRSRLYEYSVLALPAACPMCVFDLTPHEPMLDDFLARVDAQHGKVITFMPAYLFFPLDAQPKQLEMEDEGYLKWIARHGLENVKLWDAWKGTDPATIRIDGCHLNAAGHELLAKSYLDALRPQVDAWKAARAGTVRPTAETPAVP